MRNPDQFENQTRRESTESKVAEPTSAAKEEPNYSNLDVLKQQLRGQIRFGLETQPKSNRIGYASTQHILAIYGNPKGTTPNTDFEAR